MINIYTMTGIRGPRKQDGYSIYILESVVQGKTVTLTKGLNIHNMNRNQTELITLLDAAKRIKKNGEVTIFTESEWLFNAVKEWLPKWKLKEWLNSSGKEIQNAEQWKTLSEILDNNEPYFTMSDHTYKKWMAKELFNRDMGEGYVPDVWQYEYVY